MITAGKQPGDRERVNPQVVSNWFANKRKEMKKVAREGIIPRTTTLTITNLWQ